MRKGIDDGHMSGRLARCGRITSNEGFDPLYGGESDPLPTPQPADQLGVPDSGVPEAVGAHSRCGEVVLNLGEECGSGVHCSYVRDISPNSQAKYPPCVATGPWGSFLPMLRQIIREAMKRRKASDPDWSMRRASIEAGQGESYVRDILNGDSKDPGIGGVMSLADVLGIDRSEILEAVENDLGLGKARRSRVAAARIINQMTPDELAAFVSSRKSNPQ